MISFKKALWFLVVILSWTSVSFSQSTYLEVDSTPYDRQMARVQPTLTAPAGYTFDGVSLTLVNEWMSQLRAMPYRHSREWPTPSEVQTKGVADCKGKAMVLYDLLQLNGATDVRLVIGKRRAADLLTHAWLEWGTKTGDLILDPTFDWAARGKMPDRSTYIAFYAYEGFHKYQMANLGFASRRSARTPTAPAQGAISRPVRSRLQFRSTQPSFDQFPSVRFANRMAF